ncbi:hypothetical protein SAY87_016860 [Trapa incisa]|uniref:BAHD acyltransferase At5g47980-like n=1 Tax=Trapa incisa TaxID=236973 RepID=A0AAN7QUT8_9MYRT|nr:hypothetical protein SAY87_016860 [Trapa incisa]
MAAVPETTEIEIVSRETIKPSTPTPPGSIGLSLFDQLCPVLYVTVLFVYPPAGKGGSADKARRLKSSLADVLTRYYFLAGRIKDGSRSVECNDEGAAFIEAKVNCTLEAMLSKPELPVLKRLFPIDMESMEAASGLLLLVQANLFECGGLAVGVAISHKLCDGSTMSSFIEAWTRTARNPDETLAPDFSLPTLFPPLDNRVVHNPVEELPKGLCATRRYVFDSSKVSELKRNATSAAVPVPSRVEAVSAFVWKCAANASRRSFGAPSRPSVLSQAVNLRRLLVPRLPENSVGNFLGSFHALNSDPEAELQQLVGKLRASSTDYVETYPRRLQEGRESAVIAVFEAGEKFARLMMDDGLDFYNCSSWCGFGFYEADFGWGRPAWVALESTDFKNSVVLLDAGDSKGVEVWLTLRVADMEELDHDQELLEFASLNPGITW